MSGNNIGFDHVHLVCRDPNAVAQWFVDKLGGEMGNNYEIHGAPQIHVAFEGATVIVRGQRTGESAGDKGGLQYGTDHFAFRVKQNFDAYCTELKKNGVKFTMEPTQFNPTTKIAFIESPEGIAIELVYKA
jgi:catechol 2,3-dioxygenase-like lactoylglutathione lyase family enzyme